MTASAVTIQDDIEDLKAELARNQQLRDALQDDKIIRIMVDDLPHILHLADGKVLEFREGDSTDYDIALKMSGKTLLDIEEGRTTGLEAYLAGKIKAEFGLGDMFFIMDLARTFGKKR